MGMLVGTPGLPGAVTAQAVHRYHVTADTQLPRAVHMRSVVDNMALGHVLAQILWFLPSQYQFTNILYHILFICH